MNKTELKTRVLLSIQRALLGEITPNIRGITCTQNETKINICCYFEEDINEDNEESMDCVATEVAADFTDRKVDIQCMTINMSESLNGYRLLAWIYLKKE